MFTVRHLESGVEQDVAELGGHEEPDWEVVHAFSVEEVEGKEMAALRRARRDLVNLVRDGRVLGGCETSFGPIDTNGESRSNIGDAVLMASILGADFAVSWTRADDVDVALTGPEMIKLGLEIGGFVNLCHVAGRYVKVWLEHDDRTLEELAGADVAQLFDEALAAIVLAAGGNASQPATAPPSSSGE